MNMPQDQLMSQDQLFETALSLPQPERADLAFQLLLSLNPPGDEVTAEEFGSELRDRIESYRRSETKSFTLDETRAIIQQQLSEGHATGGGPASSPCAADGSFPDSLP